MAIPFINKFQGWNLATPNSGDDFDDEFDQIYANTNYLESERLNLEAQILAGAQATSKLFDVYPAASVGPGNGVELRKGLARLGSGNNIFPINTSLLEVPGASGVLNGDVKSIAISANRVLIAWGDGVQTRAVIATLDLTLETITYGTPFVFHGLNVSQMSLSKFRPDGSGERVVIAYNDGVSLFGRVLSINVSTITAGTAVTVNAGGTPGNAVAMCRAETISATAVGVFAYIQGGDCDTRAFTVSGTVISLGPVVQASGNAPGDLVDVVAVGDTRCVISFARTNNLTIRLVAGRIGNIGAGTTITTFDAPEVEIFDYDDTGHTPNMRSIRLIALNPEKLIVQHSADNTSYFQICRLSNLPGGAGAITFTGPQKLPGVLAGAVNRAVHMVALSDNKLAMVTDAALIMSARSIRIGEDEIDIGSQSLPFLPAVNVGSNAPVSISKVNASTVLVVYADITNGKIKSVLTDISQWAGVAQDGADPVRVVMSGVSSNHVGLVVGQEYGVSNTGGIVPRGEFYPANADFGVAGGVTFSDPIGYAISPTELKLY